jgi:bifunctional non-homologous end joining protein LigD
MNLTGKKVVVTGKIAGESRATASQKLMEAGAIVQTSLSKQTELLITGAKVGKQKVDKALARGIPIIKWEAVWQDEECASCPVASSYDEDVADAVESLRPVRQIAPMLAKQSKHLPSSAAWWHEVKWDGYRCIATVRDGKVSMQSRSGSSDYTDQYPNVAGALAHLPDCVIDGELVVLNDQGHSSFEAMGNGSGSLIVFDLLEHGDQDVRHLPLEARRTLLEQHYVGHAITDDACVHLSPVFTDGDELLAYVREHGLEGIVSKRRDSAYREGSRSGSWLKTKVRLEQEFVVLGWIPGENGNAGGLGALVLGYHDGDELVYAGKVGTGWTWEEGLRLLGELGGLTERIQNLPTDVPKKLAREVVMWVKPELVVQVQFQRWTKDGILWHPSYKGQRTDKRAGDVVRES